MNVPNHEKKAFRDMTPKERSAIVESTLMGNTDWFDTEEWRLAACNFMVLDGIYRTRPRQLVIPWEVIKPECKWAAMDEDGEVYLYPEKPKSGCEQWLLVGDSAIKANGALNINTTGIDWRESLTARPDGV